jgi:hypothetical protein
MQALNNPNVMTYKLSKSKIQLNVQCSKKLWLHVNRPDLAETDEMGKLLLLRGTAFGEAVRSCFPSGELIKEDKTTAADAIKKTADLMAEFSSGKSPYPIFEAAFAFEGVVVYVDMLIPEKKGGWKLLEVKSSVLKPDEPPKSHHIRDAAIQAWVVMRCGVSINSIALAQPNINFEMPADTNLDGILVQTDVTAEALGFFSEIEKFIKAANETLSRKIAPVVDMGKQCTSPNGCEFVVSCSDAKLRAAEKFLIPVWHLAGEPTSKIVTNLMSDGYRNLADVPEVSLSRPMHRVMQRISREGGFFVDKRLPEFLRSQPFPRYFLDYETSNSPLPLWIGTRPGERVVFQFSLHKWINEEGEISHAHFIGETHDDPREDLAEALVRAMEEPGPVYAWNGNSTEGPITASLAEICPRHRDALLAISDSCRENDPVRYFREWFYHPKMAGNWGLKAITQSIFEESPYKALPVANGVDAMREYEHFLKLEPGEERDTVRKSLLDYCNTDTKIMIDIWKKVESMIV